MSILLLATAAFIGSRLLRLKDSAEKLIFNFAGARLKGGKLKTAIVAGNLHIDAIFEVSNPGKAKIKIDFMMLDASLVWPDKSESALATIRVEDINKLRAENPNLFVFEPEKTSTIAIPIKIPLTSVSHLGIITKIISGKMPVGAKIKGYIQANGIRIPMDELKPFAKAVPDGKPAGKPVGKPVNQLKDVEIL